MSRLIFLGIVIAVIIVIGVAGLTVSQTGEVPGVRIQTENPNASTLAMTTEQGGWLIFWAVFLTLGPLATFAAFLTFIMWWGNREVVRARKTEQNPFSFSLDASKPRTLGSVLVRSPGLTITLVLIVLIGGAVFLALIGAFTPR